MDFNSVKNEIIVIGELNVDLIAGGLEKAPVLGHEILARDFEMTLGSASAVFACGIARLGRGVTFISRVGTDDFGQFCVAELVKKGISVEFIEAVENLKTGITIVLSTPRDRALVTYLGAIAELGFENVPLGALDGHRHLHLTSYFLQTRLKPDFSRLMAQAKQKNLTVSFDPNSDPTQNWNDEILEVFRQTDILFLNDLEALQMTQQKDSEAAIRQLGQFCPCIVIKLGADGAMAWRGGEIFKKSGFKVEAVDTTGAGDSFAAGFVHAFLNDKNLEECLDTGNACGAMSATGIGGTLTQPDLGQLENFLNLEIS